MTHLEQKIYDALMRYEDASERDIMTGSVCRGHALAAAKIALDLAYDAYNQGVLDSGAYEHGGGSRTFKQFIQDYIGD